MLMPPKEDRSFDHEKFRKWRSKAYLKFNSY